MGAGISIASNTASAIAKAYTSVINDTNVTQDQDVIQTQSITLENCDMTAKEDINFDVSATMQQSQQQIANVTNDTAIANNVAQALTQAATTSVGVGVLGIADSNNQASTYASMSTNISNYIKFSSRQSSTAKQNFTCQDSTIVSQDGKINLSMLEMGKVNQYQQNSIMNTSHVSNTITQTIKQTATASTGMSWWVILAIGVLAIIFGIIWKLKDAKSKATRAIDMQQAIELGCCTKAELNISNLSAGGIGSALNSAARSVGKGVNSGLDKFTGFLNRIGTNNNMMNNGGGGCAGCDCYKLAHPEAHISKAIVVIWIIGILLIGGMIGLWYAIAAGRTCLTNDACGQNSGSNFNGLMAGCSCDFALAEEDDVVCKDSLTGTVNGNGIPLKYQYTLFVQNQNGDTCGSGSNTISASSLQGILVQALAKQTQNTNSNNGKNLNTINRYFAVLTGGPASIFDGVYGSANIGNAVPDLLNMYKAAVTYLNGPAKDDTEFDFFHDAIEIDNGSNLSDEDQLDQQARQLFAFMCPLRPVAFQLSSGKMNLVTQTAWPKLTYTSDDTGSLTDYNLGYPLTTQTINNSTGNPYYFVGVVPAFRYGKGAALPDAQANDSAGCCSLHTMAYVKTGDKKGSEFSCNCGSSTEDQNAVTNFCSGGQPRCIYEDNNDPSSGHCSGNSSSSSCTSDSACKSSQIYNDDATGDTLFNLPPYTTSNNIQDDQSCFSSMYPAQNLVAGQDSSSHPGLGVYAEWANFSAIYNGRDASTKHEKVCAFIRLLWAGTLSYINNVSNDTIFGTNALLSNESGNETYIDYFYVSKVQGERLNTYGVIGNNVDSDAIAQVDDPQLLYIKLIDDTSYSAANGMGSASCDENATAIRGQGYVGTSKKLGYCRDKFFNRITLYTLIGILVFWVLSLPLFIIIRWYVNKGVSGKYLNAVNQQTSNANQKQSTNIRQNLTDNNETTPTTPSTPTTPTTQINQTNNTTKNQSIEMTAPTTKMKQMKLKNALMSTPKASPIKQTTSLSSETQSKQELSDPNVEPLGNMRVTSSTILAGKRKASKRQHSRKIKKSRKMKK